MERERVKRETERERKCVKTTDHTVLTAFLAPAFDVLAPVSFSYKVTGLSSNLILRNVPSDVLPCLTLTILLIKEKMPGNKVQ